MCDLTSAKSPRKDDKESASQELSRMDDTSDTHLTSCSTMMRRRNTRKRSSQGGMHALGIISQKNEAFFEGGTGGRGLLQCFYDSSVRVERSGQRKRYKLCKKNLSYNVGGGVFFNFLNEYKYSCFGVLPHGALRKGDRGKDVH